MDERVETGNKRPHQANDAYDTDWPAAWPERVRLSFALPARPTPCAIVESAPPTSARTVLTVLEPGGIRTISDLLNRTRLPARTLRHAMRWLERKGKIERLTQLGDARRGLVRLRVPRVPNFGPVGLPTGITGGVAC